MTRTVINNKAVAPYYDDYDSDKHYTQLLAMPGRVAQAREFTQIQSTVKNIIKSIGDSILKDGDIIEGCQVIVNSSKTQATVTAGKIYMRGMVLPLEETTVAITGVGTEIIGARLVEYLITEQEDSTLRDPALGYDNYNQPGCHRIQSELEITVVQSSVLNADSAIISTLLDGELFLENYAPEYDILTQTLARRTYDESGSYIVEGLNVRTEAYDNDYYNIVIEAGKAYVLGYELRIPAARRIRSPKSKRFEELSINRTYSTLGSQDYRLSGTHPYVKEILTVTGIKQVTDDTYRIASGTATMTLTQTRVRNIVSISQSGNTYTQGTSSEEGDYYLDSLNGTYYVKWNGASYPTLNQPFDVVLEYDKDFIQGTDYELVDNTILRWKSGGDSPKDATIFTVDFDQYLARRDIVYMDRYGNISVLEGIPALDTQEVAPEAPINTLVLATVSSPPNGIIDSSSSENIRVVNIGLTRFTMNDIQSIVNRLKTLEYDQAILSLNNEARNDAISNKKGIWTEPLIDVSKIDFYFNKNSSGVTIDSAKPIHDMALDLYSNIAYLPIDTHTTGVDYSTSSTARMSNRLITIEPSKVNGVDVESVVLSQMNATKSFLINPYSVFPQLPEVSVTPSVDSWIDDEIIQVPISLQDTSVIALSTRIIDTRSNRQINNSNYETRSNTSTSDTAIGTKTTSYSTDDIISERAVTYIRQRTLTVEGHDFPANLDNIKGYFDGILVSLTPTSPTLAGSIAGTVKSDSNGYLRATFTIPSNVLTGTREVVLKSDIERDGYISEGFTLYIAQGIARTIQRTVTTLTTVLLQRTTSTTLHSVYVDPVGQTFVLDRMTMLKGIDIYFESKPATATPVICEIRGVDNGTITSQIYAHKSLPATSVSVSADASVATRFDFDDPVLLIENTEYAFVVRSMSDDYTVWVAEIGGTEISTINDAVPKVVLKNPYVTGVMLSSSNNSTWTAHHTTDMKFRLVESVYELSSIAQFNNLNLSDFSRIYLSADSAIPTGTTASWAYSVDGGTTYKTITPYNIVTLNELRTNLSLRVSLSRNSGVNLSPMIALDTIAVSTSCYDNTSTSYYVSKKISNIDNYTNVKVIVDTYEPTGTSISCNMSRDSADTVINMTRTTTNTSDNELSDGWYENIFTSTVASSNQFRLYVGATSDSKAITPAFRRLRVIFS